MTRPMPGNILPGNCNINIKDKAELKLHVMEKPRGRDFVVSAYTAFASGRILGPGRTADIRVIRCD